MFLFFFFFRFWRFGESRWRFDHRWWCWDYWPLVTCHWNLALKIEKAEQYEKSLQSSQQHQQQGAVLRPRSIENKAVVVAEVEKNVWPAIEAGKVKPVIHKYLPLSQAAEAHSLMESSNHIGKILFAT